MNTYYGLIGIGIVVALTVLACLWMQYFSKGMPCEACDEYGAEQARLSWEAKKAYGVKPNKLTAINAVNGEKT